MVVIKQLIERGATVCAYDPVALEQARRLIGAWKGVELASNAAAAVRQADALLIVTEWKEFRSPDFPSLRQALKQPVIFDGRNLFDAAFARSEHIEYHCIGRPTEPAV